MSLPIIWKNIRKNYLMSLVCPIFAPGMMGNTLKHNPGHVFFGLNGLIARLRKEGKCPIDRDTVIYIRQPIPNTVAVNTIRVLDVDASDIDDLTRAEVEAHLQIIPLVNMLKEHVPGFQDAYISSVNPVIGVRESRRIMGIKN